MQKALEAGKALDGINWADADALMPQMSILVAKRLGKPVSDKHVYEVARTILENTPGLYEIIEWGWGSERIYFDNHESVGAAIEKQSRQTPEYRKLARSKMRDRDRQPARG